MTKFKKIRRLSMDLGRDRGGHVRILKRPTVPPYRATKEVR